MKIGYQSVRYAYVWCYNLASWDPTMGADTPMIDLYDEYAASARHLDHVAEKFNFPDDVIEPIDFDTWYEIFVACLTGRAFAPNCSNRCRRSTKPDGSRRQRTKPVVRHGLLFY